MKEFLLCVFLGIEDMSTAKGLEEMRADLMVVEEQLRAKCALLEEAMSVIANIPPHPANNDFIPVDFFYPNIRS